MPWEVSIRIIDVGQGESSFIQVKNTDTGMYRNMLIDGGLQGQASVVNQQIITSIRAFEMPLNTPVHTIVISHYDNDHSDGIIQLLKNDNAFMICDCINFYTSSLFWRYYNNPDVNTLQFIGGISAGVVAVLNGAYNNKDYHAVSELLLSITDEVVNRLGTKTMTDIKQARTRGINIALDILNSKIKQLNNSLFKSRTALFKEMPFIVFDYFLKSGVFDNFRDRTGTFPNLMGHLLESCGPRLAEGEFINTFGRFRESIIFDVKDQCENNFVNKIIGGEFRFGSCYAQVPGINRERFSTAAAMLGKEIMWLGSDRVAPHISCQHSFPMVFAVACDSLVWSIRRVQQASGSEKSNMSSIGLILKFNEFCYYTGGDLESDGEELIARSMMGAMPIVADRQVQCPRRIAVFKCGHHGSGKSTSDSFLKQINPVVAFISCGVNPHGHPKHNTLVRLNKSSIVRCYLTGAKVDNRYIILNQNKSQQTKFRVAKAYPPVDASFVGLGHILLLINEEQSSRSRPYFKIVYFEAEIDKFVADIIHF